MSVPRYPAYKDSGVEWLELVPAHWDVCPLKVQFQIVGGSTPKSNVDAYWDGDIPWATPSDLGNGNSLFLRSTQRGITREGLESCGATLVPPGSILLSTRAPIGSLALATFWVCTNQGCRSLVPKTVVSPEYFARVLSVSGDELNIRGKGTTFAELSADSLGAFKSPVPPPDEQFAIADFLERETAKIDALIAEQQRLIDLLKEKRQAVISHAVTKGLNPHAPMKPSGIEWLGDVPAHWEVSKMKWVARMESGHTPDRKIADYWDGDIPWVSLNDTGYLRDNDYISETAYNITERGMANSSAHVLPVGTVVFSRDATIGRCGITARPMAVSQHYIGWVCGQALVPEFLLLRLRSMTQELERLTTGATLRTIGMPDVRTLVTPVPPLAEQRDIVAWVSSEAARLDNLIAAAGHAVDVLQERRTALISAAVTGQIDVRSLAEVQTQ